MAEENGTKLKRKVKDSVFTDLFAQKRYLIQLYRALHPEDTESDEDDITIVTLQNVITDSLYNDLGFLVKDRLVVLVEAQSTWSPNIVIRALLYLMRTYNDYFTEHETDLYASAKINLPCPELYVVYTGEKKDVPNKLNLADEFFCGQNPMIDATVNILRDGMQGDILSQYVAFTRVCKEQVALYGRTQKAVEEIVHICQTTNILAEYMKSREKEVKNIMFTLYDEEEILRRHDKTVAKIAEQKGVQNSIKKLMDNLKLTQTQAMDALGIDPSERDVYTSF